MYGTSKLMTMSTSGILIPLAITFVQIKHENSLFLNLPIVLSRVS